MSKKFEFECIWAYGGAIGNNYVDENSIDVSIGEPKNLPSFDDFQKLAGKRVRVTIEPLPVAPDPSGPSDIAFDLEIYGVAYTCEGRRLDPTKVSVIYPAPGPGADDSNGGGA